VDTAISPTLMRIVIAAVGVLVLLGIYFFGRPGRAGHGRRTVLRRGSEERIEPVIGDTHVDADGTAVRSPHQGELHVDADHQADGPDTGGAGGPPRPASHFVATPPAGRRPHDRPVERIVTLFVVARGDGHFRGSNITVAAEKAGLKFGDMHIFHRLVDGKPEASPVFSMANMVKPGSFDMNRIGELVTPGLSFFITLPGPMSALDAWDTMLPAAQRIAELLDGKLLDEDRNALGHQRIAVLRDELRAWDRRHEARGPEIRMPPLR
jgi:cell division protein ZipA